MRGIDFRSMMQERYLTAEEERDLILSFQGGDERAGDQVIHSHFRYAFRATAKFCNGSVSHPMFEDLLQEAFIGLVRALKRFDVGQNVRFATFARWWVEACLHEYLLKNWHLVSGNFKTAAGKRIFYKIQKAARKQNSGDARPLHEVFEDLAKECGVPLKRVEEEWYKVNTFTVPLDAKLISGTKTYGETFVDPSPLPEETVGEHMRAERLTRLVREAVANLKDPRQRHVIETRILAEEPLTLQQLSDEMGVSRERVRQIESRALQLIRPDLEHLRELVAA